MNGWHRADRQNGGSSDLGFEAKLRAPYAVRLPGPSIGHNSSCDQESNPITRRLAKMNPALRGSVAGFVDCVVTLPGQFFYSTQIPVCLWFLAKNKNADAKRGFRDRLEVGNQLALAACIISPL